MKRRNPFERPVYDHLDLIIAAMGIALALLAVCYSIGQYQLLFGHKPY